MSTSFLVAIILLSIFLANLNASSNESGSQRRTSCWILSFKDPMNTSILCSYGISFTLMFNFWNSSMCSIIEPFCLRLINWLKKVFLFVSSIMCKTHKRYVWQLYIRNQISLYGINGFSLVKIFSLGQFLRKN